MPDELYAELEQKIYEAAVVPELWPEVIRQLAEISHSAGGILMSGNERGVHWIGTEDMRAPVTRFFEEGWNERNSRAGGVISRGLVGLPRFVNEDDYFTPGQEQTDPMIQEVLKPAGLGYAAGFLLKLPHGDLVTLNIEQYWERGPIRGDDLARLDSLYPHLARSAMLAGRLDLQRLRSAIDMLAAIGLPAAALSPRGTVIYANEGFDAGSAVWTTRHGDRIALRDKVADAQLSEALRQIDGTVGHRSFPVRAVAEGNVTSVLHVVPVRRTAHDIFGSAVAIAVLTEPKASELTGPLIQALFDLTPAEVTIAEGVAQGRSVAEMAARSGRSEYTVRNHLKSVMAKTGSRRQLDLALLMTRGVEKVPR